MKLAVATTNYPHQMPEVFVTLDSAIKEYADNGFEIVANLNTQSDLSRGGVRMERKIPLCETAVIEIVLVDVRS